MFEFLKDIPPAVLFFGAVGAIVIASGILANLRWALVACAIMLFASSVSYSVDPFTDKLIPTLFTPLQLYRNFIFMFGGGLCYLAIASHLGKFNASTFNPAGILLIAIAFYAGCVRILAGHTDVGLLSIALAFLSIVPLVFVLPNLIQRREQAYTLMRWVLLVMGIWIIINTVQFLVNPSVLYPADSGRFQGLTGNPQFAAVLFAFSSIMCTWVAVNDPSKIVRMFAIASASALIICIAWSGSRTGAGMFVIGAMIILASRVGQLVLLAPFALGFAYFFLTFVIGDVVNIDTSRLTSTQNTRSGSFAAQIQTFLANPLFGTGNPNEAGASENSYFLALSAYGIFMGVLVFSLLGVCANMALKLFRRRKNEDKLGKALTDLAMAGIAMFFAGAFLEGYMMSRVHSATVFLIIVTAIGKRLLDTAPAHDAIEAHDGALRESSEDAYEDEAYADQWQPPQENVWDPAEDWQEPVYALTEYADYAEEEPR